MSFEGDITGTRQLRIGRAAALHEVDSDVAGTFQCNAGRLHVPLFHLDVAGAYERHIRGLRLQAVYIDVAGADQFGGTVVADDVFEVDVAGATQNDAHIVGIHTLTGLEVAGAVQMEGGQVGRGDVDPYLVIVEDRDVQRDYAR